MGTITKTDTSCCKMKSVGGYCPKPIESLSGFISKKWAMSIIITIGNFGTLRFNDLKDRLEKATAKILSERLKELGKEGIIKKRSFNEVPPRVEYSLTNKGEGLLKNLKPIIRWSEEQSNLR